MFKKTLLIATSIVALSLGTAAFAQTAPHAANRTNTVMHAQQALQAQGLYHGRVDGRNGTRTRKAVTQFQAQHGLKQTGRLDRETLADLRSTGGAGAPSNGNAARRNNAGARSAPSASPLEPRTNKPRENPGPTQPPS